MTTRFDWTCAACGGDRFDVNGGEAYCVECKTADGYCFACGAGRESASIYPLELGNEKRVVCHQQHCQETALWDMREKIEAALVQDAQERFTGEDGS